MKQVIQIDSSLHLVPYFLTDHRDVALTWNQGVESVELVDGVSV